MAGFFTRILEAIHKNIPFVETIYFGGEKHIVHLRFPDENVGEIRYDDRNFTLYTAPAMADLKDAWAEMRKLSIDYGGDEMIGRFNGNTVITSLHMSVEETHALYMKGAQTIDEAFANYQGAFLEKATRKAEPTMPTISEEESAALAAALKGKGDKEFSNEPTKSSTGVTER
jgi:hypothetical protein